MTPGMEWLFGFLYFEYFSPLIVTALGARAMGQFSLVTIWTLGKRARRQEIVSATSAGALLGVPPFWIRHEIPFVIQLLAAGF
jgi:hypothetical protein